MKQLFLYFAAVLIIFGCQQNETSSTDENAMEPEPPSIVGAWEIVGYSATTPDSTWKGDAPFRSVILFTNNYYSVEIAQVERPSWAERPNGERPTNEEITNAFNGLTSNSGKYEIQGDSIRYTALIAKYPNFMNDSPSFANGFVVDGDKLTITGVMRGNSEGSLTTTYRRLE